MLTILRKQPWKIFCIILHIIVSKGGSKLAKLPKCVHGHNLDMFAYIETKSFNWSLYGESYPWSIQSQNAGMLQNNNF